MTSPNTNTGQTTNPAARPAAQPATAPAANPGAKGRRRASYIGAGTTPPAPRPRLGPELMATLATRLTGRDRWLLELLWEHRVLTTHHIRDLAYASTSATTHRMLLLWRLRAVERFRPTTPAGSAPWHYVLGPAGAHVLAARRGVTVAQLGYRTETALAPAHSDKLHHLVGANGVFTALVAHARTHPGCGLDAWWSEHRCRHTWGKVVRPDGYGRWHDGPGRIDFFLEYDTGTEPLGRLLAKVGDYIALAEMTGIATTPVLFILPNPAREAHVHARITPGIPLVATTTSQALAEAGGPAGPAWHPTTVGRAVRVRLADLSHHEPASKPDGRGRS